MSKTPEWKGGRIGPYEIGKRFHGIAEDEGRLYEARHIETGESALAVMPGTGDHWRTRTQWEVMTTNFVHPDVLIVHPKRQPGQKVPSLHELALGYIRVADALTHLDGREDGENLFSRESRPSRPRAPVMRWGLAGAAVALSVGLVLLLWPRTPERMKLDNTPKETPVFADGQDHAPNVIAYPMPETPFKEQRRPPCIEGRETEIRGGCWIQHKLDAPCPKGTAEHEGKCYVPVKKPDPLPSSVKP